MLEEKIDELTAAVKELTAVMSAGAAPKATRKTKKTKEKEVKEEPEVPATDTEPPTEEETPDQFPVTLDMVKRAIIAITDPKSGVDNGRDVAIAVLEEFGAKKASELKEEDYCMVLKVLKEGLNKGGESD